jgi:hypothetical protein
MFSVSSSKFIIGLSSCLSLLFLFVVSSTLSSSSSSSAGVLFFFPSSNVYACVVA